MVNPIHAAVCISLGASCGALLRWFFNTQLNALASFIPMGTLTANLLGGFLAGVAVGVFNAHPWLNPEWRLIAVTGFLGGLTTFSSFSAEAAALLQAGKWGLACGHIGLHVVGSITLTLLGIMVVYYWYKP